MTYSLNEVELLAKRAARGAGYPWGLAEEAAKASRWLCSQDIDGCGELAQLLQRNLAANLSKHAPQNIDAIWQGEELLCPILTGALLSDSAAGLQDASIKIHRLASPAFLLPFGANVARLIRQSVTLECDGARACTDGILLDAPDSFPEQAAHIMVQTGDAPTPARFEQTRANPSPEIRAILNHFAQKTYAPATEESRLFGAGAGVSDND